MKNPKTKRSEAERAAVWYARVVLGCVMTRKAVQTRFQKQDFFGADVVGKMPDGSHVYIQATAGQSASVAQRRRKLEAVPWLDSDIVQVVQLRHTEDPANARRKLWFFRVHEYRNINGPRGWAVANEAVHIPREWFTAWSQDKQDSLFKRGVILAMSQ